MATIITGQSTTGLKRTREGWREYTLISLVKGELTDGPFAALNTPGLPQPGDEWSYRGDSDPWAFCSPEADVKPHGRKETEPGNWWSVEQKFTNRPDAGHCKDQSIEDPLLQPDDISGGFTRFNEEAVLDRFGEPIVTSSHEVVRGPQVEFDAIRGTVKIKQNRAALELELLVALANCVNDREMWGLPPRCIKFIPAGWSRKFWGACSVYFERSLEFEARVNVSPSGVMSSGFDRDIRDEGTMVLNGEWDRKTRVWTLKKINGKDPDPANPKHFVRATDVNGTPIRILLDGNGKPWSKDPPQITTCAACPEGAAQKWTVAGIPGDKERAYKPFAGAKLTYASGCTWSFSPENNTALGSLTLTFSDPVWELNLITLNPNTNELNAPERWTIPKADFQCLGTNQMEADGPDGLAAADHATNTLTISAGDGTEPGQIHVEKYREANLFLLGIPTVLA